MTTICTTPSSWRRSWASIRLTASPAAPGDCPESKNPNWVVCAWPNEFCEVVDWQWKEVLIPYWKDFVAFAKAHGVNKIALEMHQGFCVYKTPTP